MTKKFQRGEFLAQGHGAYKLQNSVLLIPRRQLFHSATTLLYDGENLRWLSRNVKNPTAIEHVWHFQGISWNLMLNSIWHVCSSFSYLINLITEYLKQTQKSLGITNFIHKSDILHLYFHSSILFCELIGNTWWNLKCRQTITGGIIASSQGN